MKELEQVLRRAQRRLEEVKARAYVAIAPLECEAWLFDAPEPYPTRTGGQRMTPGSGQAWPGGMRHAWLRLYGAAPAAQSADARLAARVNLTGELLAVDGAGVPVCALRAGAGLEDGMLPLDGAALTDGVDVWLRAELTPEAECLWASRRPAAELCVEQPELHQLCYDMEVAIGLARARDGARRVMIGRALQRALGVLTDLNEERALAAIYALRPELERVSGDYGFMLSAVGNLRVDAERAALPDGAARQFARMTASALRLMDDWDGYVTGAGRAQSYDALMRGEPELFERVRERVSQGRWEIQGAMWAEPDMRATTGEAIVRQILYGKRFYARNFGLDVNAVWLQASPWVCAQLPQIMRRSGIQYLLCGSAARPDEAEFPYTSFWLQGQDGSRVLAHVPAAGGMALPEDVCAAERGCGELGLTEGALMLYGAAGTGPDGAQMERLERMSDLRGLPPVRCERAMDFLERLRRSRVELPWWSGELSGSGASDALTADVRLCRLGRRLDGALRQAEFVLTAMQLRGAEYPRAELNELWRQALTWQACGAQDAEARAARRHEYGALIDRLRELTGRCWSGERGLDVVLNPHAWTVDMWLPGGGECGADEGLRVSLPPMSASSTIGARRVALPERTADERTLVNDRLRLRFDERGRLASVYDKRQDWEVLRGAGDQLSVYAVDEADADAGAPRRVGAFAQISARSEIDGAICRRVAEYGYGESRIEQTVEITAGSSRVDFITRVYWRETGRLLRAEFPLNVSAGRFRCDAPFGGAERPAHRNTPRAQTEVNALDWADLSQVGRGAALMLDGGSGYGCLDNVLSVSLMRARDSEAGDGCEIRYALYPHAGDIVEVTRQASAFHRPPQLAQGPTFGPICWVDARNVVLDTVKLAEDSQDIVLRMYECLGASCTARLRTGFEVESASVCDLMERVTAPLTMDGEVIELEFAPFEIKTLVITPRG